MTVGISVSTLCKNVESAEAKANGSSDEYQDIRYTMIDGVTKKEYLSEEEIADRVGKSKPAVVNTMRLLNLPDKAKKAMVEHKLTEGVMRPLVNADPEIIDRILPKIIDEGWTARRVEREMQELKKKSSVKAVKISAYKKQEDALSKKYAANFRVRGRTISITCKTDDEVRELLEKL